MTLTAELNQKAKAILLRELGPVDYDRFIQQYQKGTGDYARDHHLWLCEESSRILHEQAARLVANGELSGHLLHQEKCLMSVFLQPERNT